METIIQLLTELIDYKLVVLIILGGYWSKKYFGNLLPSLPTAHKVLIISVFLSSVYYFIAKGSIITYIITYMFATSFYELAVKPLENWATKLFNSDK